MALFKKGELLCYDLSSAFQCVYVLTTLIVETLSGKVLRKIGRLQAQ
jgi:hypothetical protein